MKNTSLILSVISLIAVVVFGVLTLTKGGKQAEPATEEAATEAAQKGDIVYVDLDRILMEYDMANDLRSSVQAKIQKIEEEVQRKGKKLEKDITAWQEKLNKGLMTRTVAEAQQVKLQKQQEAIAADRKSQVGTGDRSERIRTYNYPQGRVTDHRIGLTLYKIEQILNGDLDEVVDSLITHYRTEMLKSEEEA